MVHNSAACIIIKSPSLHHFVTVFQQLHWLLVKPILLCAFKFIHSLTYPSLSDLLHIATPIHSLMSSSSSVRLTVPSTCPSTMWSRALTPKSGTPSCQTFTLLTFSVSVKPQNSPVLRYFTLS